MSKIDRLSLSLFETRILWVISKKPVHGYAIIKELNKGGKKITNGTLYPVLQKLLGAKLVRVKSKGVRKMKIYEITANGRKTLKNACMEVCVMFSEIFNNFVCRNCGAKVKKVGY